MATRIWVVDDDELVRSVLETMLKELGFEVRLFEKPEEALLDYSPRAADALIVDLRMPGMNGLDLTRALLTKDPGAIVIILTGYPSIPDAVEAIQIGAADFLSKPCRMEELRLRINRALDKRRLQSRLKVTSKVLWTLVETLPLWIILGMVLAKYFGRH